MKIDKEIIDQMEEDRKHQDYRLEKILLNFTAEICARMEDLGVNRAELAKRLGTSRAFVSKVLGCSHNITLKTMDSISYVLGMELNVQVHEMKSIEEQLAARNGFVLYDGGRGVLECPGYKAIGLNRVLINESPITQTDVPWPIRQITSWGIDKKQERANEYDYNEVQ